MANLIICLDSEPGANYPRGFVLNVDMEVIGDANSYTYGGSAFAVHTKEFGGYVAFRDCDLYRKDAAGFYPCDIADIDLTQCVVLREVTA